MEKKEEKMKNKEENNVSPKGKTTKGEMRPEEAKAVR